MRKYPFFIKILLAVIGFNTISCKEKKTEQNVSQDKAITVITEKVGISSEPSAIYVSGNVDANKTVRLGFMVAGKISQINASEGQNVKQGQLIASLDPGNYSIAKEIADIQVNQVTDEYGRLKLLHDRNSLSESDFKKVDFTLQGAKAQQKLHAKNLADTKLFSPISGILLKKLAEPGEIVGTGTPILVISDINRVKVNAYIPESQLSQIKIGQNAEVNIAALNETFTGKVQEVGGVADPTTRAFTIKVEVSNSNQKIRPGMIAEVKLASGDDKKSLFIPSSAIMRSSGGQSYVFVVDNNKAYQRNISIGGMSADKIEVVSGLESGETLVVGGQQKLTNGATVSFNSKN